MAADKANRTECRRSSALSGRFEDWGWELPAIQGSNSYYLGMSGNSDESSTNKDEGEWRIIVEKKRSFGQRLKGTGKIAVKDEMVRTIEEILCAEPTVR